MARTRILCMLFIPCLIFSHDKDNFKNKWFVGGGAGVQISGYKKVDFVSKNVSPSIILTSGLWLSPSVALQTNYKGYYFHTISDDDQHHFCFLFGELKLDLIRLILKPSSMQKSKIYTNAGLGYFYNSYYNEPNYCINVGGSVGHSLSKNVDLFVELSAVIGWDIYQGDEDILPSAIIGLNYNLKKLGNW
jgi:hypothetical protein